MNTSKKKKDNNWLEKIYYVGMLVSIFFILGQAYYAKRSIIQSSEWEKAKMTIQNIEQFKESLMDSRIERVWTLGDKIWADLSTPKGWDLSDTLRLVYDRLYSNDRDKMEPEYLRTLDILDAFAYPIIMGYASELGSYQGAVRQYYTYSNFIMSRAFHIYRNIGLHAKLLYRLWRIRYEIMVVDNYIAIAVESKLGEEPSKRLDDYEKMLRERIDHLLFYEEPDISLASFQKYRKTLDKKLSEMQKEIEVFRKNSLK